MSFSIKQQATELSGASPQQILHSALQHFERIALAFSGAEDVVLVDMLAGISDGATEIFCLDTGRLHPQTWEFIERVRKHYGVSIELLSPQPEAVQALVREKGLFSFYQDGHQECCNVRKVEPLARKLADLDAWITGQRQDQSPTRTDLPVVQRDHNFFTRQQPLVKFNPLADWSSAQVWAYIRERQVPYNPLHDQGYMSIGCQPCTRPVAPHEHERAGRWWWEEATRKECGLHIPLRPGAP